MGITQPRILVTGLLLLLTFVSGLGLSRFPRLYNGWLEGVHKLGSLGAIVLLILLVIKSNRISALSSLEWTGWLTAGLLFLIAIASGALVSGLKPVPWAMLSTHRIAPYFAVLLTAATLYISFVKAR